MHFAHTYSLPEELSDTFATFNDEPSMTQQADAKDCDINVIMARYQQTGQLPQVLQEPLFGDFTNPMDFREMNEKLREAEEAFLEIPPQIRAQFGNDPGEFIKFCTDEKNREQLEKWGLTQPKPEPTIEEQTLNAIKDLKPKENANGSGPK